MIYSNWAGWANKASLPCLVICMGCWASLPGLSFSRSLFKWKSRSVKTIRTKAHGLLLPKQEAPEHLNCILLVKVQKPAQTLGAG